jgi:hypothetical protein
VTRPGATPTFPHTTPSVVPVTTTLPGDQQPSAKGQRAICAAYRFTVRGSLPALGFTGSTRGAPLGLLGQTQASGSAVRAAAAAEGRFLTVVVHEAPAATRQALAPLVASERQVLAVVARDHDALARVNADRRLRRADADAVAPPATAASALAGLVAACRPA